MNLTFMETKELALLKAGVRKALDTLEVCDYCGRVSECRHRGLGGAYLCSDCSDQLLRRESGLDASWSGRAAL